MPHTVHGARVYEATLLKIKTTTATISCKALNWYFFYSLQMLFHSQAILCKFIVSAFPGLK